MYQTLAYRIYTILSIYSWILKDFYSVHGEDAFYIVQNVYKTSSIVKYLGGS